MSRQFDEVGYFELYGIEYRLIDPKNTEELMLASKVRSALEAYISGLMHDEDSSVYDNLLQEQVEYINEYIESLGFFDSSILANNIIFLAKKYGMHIGELEETIGVSAGYLSRTIKENSKKKISIDIVWKIAKLFGTDIKTLTEDEMWVMHANTDLIVRFLNRLYEDTYNNYFMWENEGGVLVGLNERYKEIGFAVKSGNDEVAYCSRHLNPDVKWILAKDIVSLKHFEDKKDLVIVPYKAVNKTDPVEYDFLFVWSDDNRLCWEKIFCTMDDSTGKLRNGAERLYVQIEQSELDVKLSTKMQQLISKYVMEERTE